MNERIKEVRKAKNLSQKDFAKNINLSQNHMSSIEKGVRAVTDRIVENICKVYNVDKNWLTTGEGKMFKDPLEPFIIEDPEIRNFIQSFMQMDENIQKDFMSLVMKYKKK